MEDKEQTKLKAEKLKRHPKEESHFLSHLLFCWELSIIITCWKNELNENNLFVPLQEYESRGLGDKMEKAWQEEENRKNPSLVRAFMRIFASEFVLLGLWIYPFEIIYLIVQPLYLRKLLDYYTPKQTAVTVGQACSYASIIVVLNLLRTFLLHWTIMQLTILGMKIRIACSSLIYRKSLNLKHTVLQKITSGQVVNLLSSDVTRIERLIVLLHYLWIAPINVIAGMCYIYSIEPSATSGIAAILFFLMLQILVSKKLAVARSSTASRTDHRIRLTNDVISTIQTIKLYGWESFFAKLVESSRRSEMKKVGLSNQARILSMTWVIYVSKICIFVITLAAITKGLPLTSQFFFPLYSIYDNLRIVSVFRFCQATIWFTEARISVQRIQEFLTKTRSTKLEFQGHIHNKPVGVDLRNVSDKRKPPVLSCVNFKAISGELVNISGAVGSGKSTLLQIILKEVDVEGDVDVEGVISYAAQEPWIFSGSIKQNILFGQAFDLHRYLKVVKVCALEHDLSLLVHGDQTLVGEKGSMLSGGQKSRISLARAVYRDADIYLLDDPLSAVDANVAQLIFNECISGFLKEKCVVLVGHKPYQNVDRTYIVESGMVVVVEGRNQQKVENLRKQFSERKGSFKKHSLQSEVQEHRSSGTNFKVYKDYTGAAGHWSLTFLVVLLFLLRQILINGLDYFMAFWVNLEQKAINVDPRLTKFFNTDNCLYIYTTLLVLLVLTAHTASLLFVVFCQKVSTKLHDTMLHKIINGPAAFFQHHSSGRILNRFATDMGCVDEEVPTSLMTALGNVFAILGMVCIITISNYWMLVPTIILLGVVVRFSCIFQRTNRSIARTEGITRSAIFGHLSASLQGLTTIRAFQVQQKISEEFDRHQDFHSSAFYLFTSTFAAFGFWTDMACLVYNCLVIFSFFLLSFKPSVGDVGLAITQSVALLGMVPFAVKNWGELDGQMVSVERVMEYAELDPEADDGVDTPSKDWPHAGNLSFHSVLLQFSSPVLKSVSFQIKSGEKVGIVGRTGAGKTSLISVLFRLFPFEGFVVIDGVDTKKVPLNVLRSKISIIPQEPVLFLGTLRKNIDPFNEHSDNQIWNCLEEIELKEMVSKLPSGLDSVVSERGSNFSVGQRQLLCLVRAMLRSNKIIVLDEATANVDLKTDDLIQSTIRKKFKDCTVLTIAHRLNTVIDSDKILVMDDGSVIEFDHPEVLLRNTKGLFYEYVKNSRSLMDLRR